MKTNVLFLLDSTGSMSSIRANTIDSFNEYISELKNDEHDYTFSLVTFNSDRMEQVFTGVPIDTVPLLTQKAYQTRSMTPLYDAMGKFTSEIDHRRKSVIIVVLTDGRENRSREWTRDSVRALIEDRQRLGWRFLFLGADFDAFAVGSALGIRAETIVQFDKSKVRGATVSAYRATSSYAAQALDSLNMQDEHDDADEDEEDIF